MSKIPNIAKRTWRSDPSNQMMDDTSIELIQQVIEDDDFEYKYVVNLSYQINDYDWLHDNDNHDQEVKSWCDYVANRQKSHLHTYVVKNQEWEKPHYHMVVCSEKPLSIGKMKSCWKYGTTTRQVIQPYEPEVFKRLNADGDGGYVPYMYRWHRATRTRQTHCPCKHRDCRSGKCPHK